MDAEQIAVVAVMIYLLLFVTAMTAIGMVVIWTIIGLL